MQFYLFCQQWMSEVLQTETIDVDMTIDVNRPLNFIHLITDQNILNYNNGIINKTFDNLHCIN